MTTVPPELIIVGRVRKAHGIRGDLVVEPITDEPDAVFAPGRRVIAGTASGDPAKDRRELHVTAASPFKGGLIVHLVTQGPSSTEVQVYELVPSVWVGEHWAFTAHGVGVGRYHDIRFVEPTVTDRVKTLELLDRVLKN